MSTRLEAINEQITSLMIEARELGQESALVYHDGTYTGVIPACSKKMLSLLYMEMRQAVVKNLIASIQQDKETSILDKERLTELATSMNIEGFIMSTLNSIIASIDEQKVENETEEVIDISKLN